MNSLLKHVFLFTKDIFYNYPFSSNHWWNVCECFRQPPNTSIFWQGFLWVLQQAHYLPGPDSQTERPINSEVYCPIIYMDLVDTQRNSNHNLTDLTGPGFLRSFPDFRIFFLKEEK